MYDIIIIGGGPAGISAGIYAVSRGKKTLIIEKSQIGGIIGKVSTVTHYSAIVENESGATFAERLKRQALHAGVEIRYENEDIINIERHHLVLCQGKIGHFVIIHSRKNIIVGRQSDLRTAPLSASATPSFPPRLGRRI